MTEQEQRIAIAEACGWEFRPECGPLDLPWWHRPTKRRASFESLPKYLHDLNAMFAAEDTLSDSQVQLYIDHLAAVTGAVTIYSKLDLKCTNHWSIYHATAAQRAEAFLKTLGKWKD